MAVSKRLVVEGVGGGFEITPYIDSEDEKRWMFEVEPGGPDGFFHTLDFADSDVAAIMGFIEETDWDDVRTD